MAGADLLPDELRRYARHLALPDFGSEGQRKLKEASVLVVGAGGLGCPVLLYLTAAGVGHIGIIDHDAVDVTNLHRQVLYGLDDVGRPKAEAAVDRLKALNPHVRFSLYHAELTSANALDLIRQYDVVADGSDNFPTRYLVNDACVLMDKVDVHAGIFRYEGQLSVFNQCGSDGRRGPNYRDLHPRPPAPDAAADCGEAGVLGVLPGILGTMQALEVIKVITGVGDTLHGRVYLFDARTFTSRTMALPRDPANPLSGEHPTQTRLVDYEAFCGAKDPVEEQARMEIGPLELKSWMDRGKLFQLVDVREAYERAMMHIGGDHIPLDRIPDLHELIHRDRPVVLYCRSGARSAMAIQWLREVHGLQGPLNLKGGMLAWEHEVGSGAR